MLKRQQCPKCSSSLPDVRDYESMLVVSRTYALFTVRCPACDTCVSMMHEIPPELMDEVQLAAHQVGAGMGRE